MDDLLTLDPDLKKFRSARYPKQRRAIAKALGIDAMVGDRRSIADIAREVAAAHHVDVTALYKKGGPYSVVTIPRQEIWYRAYHELGKTTGGIGLAFSRDPSTILFGIVRWAQRNNLLCLCHMKKAVDYRPAGS